MQPAGPMLRPRQPMLVPPPLRGHPTPVQLGTLSPPANNDLAHLGEAIGNGLQMMAQMFSRMERDNKRQMVQMAYRLGQLQQGPLQDFDDGEETEEEEGHEPGVAAEETGVAAEEIHDSVSKPEAADANKKNTHEAEDKRSKEEGVNI